MKRLFPVLLVLLLTACGAPKAGDIELTVFAAASLQEALTKIGEDYQKDHPNIDLVFSFDSSGTLKTQIQEGAECDIFISAGQRQMDQLDASADAGVNTEGLDFVDSGTRFDLLENKVVLAVPEGDPKDIGSYDDLRTALEAGDILLAIGSSDVPVGQYTQKIFAYWGLDEEALASSGVLTYGSNVKEVTTQVSEGTVDCGIIYATDASSAGLAIVDTATVEMCGRAICPAAVLKGTAHHDAAVDFLAYLGAADGGRPVFERAGFTMIS